MKTKIRQLSIGHIVFSLIALFIFLLCVPSHVYAQRTITAGSAQTFRAGVASGVRSARLSDDKIIVTYSESVSTSSNRYVRAGTVNSETRTINWGDAELIGSGFGTALDIVALSSTKAALFVENSAGDPDLMQYCVLDINGTDITAGTVTTFTSDEVSNNASYRAAALSGNQVVVCYERASDTNLQVMTGTISGTTITWGSAVTFDSNISFTGICRLTDSKFIVAWEDDDITPDAGKIRVGEVSGTTITPGTSTYTFGAGSAVGCMALTALSEESFALTWEDDGSTVPADPAKVQFGTVSGTVISFPGNSPSFLDNVNNDLTISPLSSSEVIVAMSAAAGTPDYYAYCTLSGNDFSVTTHLLLNNRADDASAVCLTSDLFVISFIDYYNTVGVDKYGMSKVFTVAAGSNPEINVQGNGVDIECGDDTPSTADSTDFGTGASLSSTFTIQNLGAGTLTLGSNAVTITGTDAANFSVHTQPATTVSGSSSTTFVIDFASASATIHSAEIHINSDDIHEPDYFFSIQATGASTPTITFINGANAGLDFQQVNPNPPEDNWLLGQFSLAGDDTGTTLTSVTVTLGGSYSESDFGTNPFRLYARDNVNDFSGASAIGSDVAYAGSGNDITFSSLSDAIPSGTRYYWVTADVSSTATSDDTINGTINAAEDVSISGGTLSGSSSYGKLNAGEDATLPVELSAFTAQYIENTPTIHWSTQSETDNMGWFIYRSNENNFSASKVISEMIEGHGTTTQEHFYIYKDKLENAEVGDSYYYWLESVDYSGIINHYDKVAVLTIHDHNDPGNNGVTEPEQYGLFQNEPNPVISSTRISFNLTETAQVDLALYNLKGQLVKNLYSGVTSKHTVMWNGRDEGGKQLENGIYFYELVVNGKPTKTKRLILMK